MWHRATASDPLVALDAVHRLRVRLRDWEHDLVQEARQAGCSWHEIAETVDADGPAVRNSRSRAGLDLWIRRLSAGRPGRPLSGA